MAEIRQAAKTAPGLFTLPVRAWVCPNCGASSPPELGVNQDTAALLLAACKDFAAARTNTQLHEAVAKAEAAIAKAEKKGET